ncbi:phasin family protein [Marinobacter salinisoli]|uniref:Phasin family protein n=1 Tax=Marinobacter salinisoli TaxID=2769486 RepID=A0ABX7MPT0_9GAMM|nr:phasin family protein [Marinobacter salinisoli]QSP94315.1 phasin family protein [Marinobacter salinisoli]
MFTDTLKFSAEPVTRLNKLVMNTCESLVDAQIASLHGYMGLLEEQAKSATAIRDFDGIKGFVEEQPQRFSQLVERVSEDFKQFSKVAEDFRKDAGQVFQSEDEPATGGKPAAPAKQASAGTKKPSASSN